MPASGRPEPTADATLRPGTGPLVRREYALRAAVAIGLAVAFAGVAVYGAYGAAADSGVPFLVFGAAGAVAQIALAVAFLTARAAIDGDRYHKTVVTRVRRIIAATLALLLVAVVIGFIVGTATLDAGLATLMAVGLIAVFGLTADGWRHLRHLG
jgi:hypothetical protein